MSGTCVHVGSVIKVVISEQCNCIGVVEKNVATAESIQLGGTVRPRHPASGTSGGSEFGLLP